LLAARLTIIFARGVITGALAGCFAVLVHSFFDFTLHTTANALLFLILAALATQDSRVDQTSQHRGLTVGEAQACKSPDGRWRLAATASRRGEIRLKCYRFNESKARLAVSFPGEV